jgi:DNA-binding MarR family transcriptional regulator
MAKLKEELKQRAPFTLEQEAFLSVVRSADWLMRGIVEILKPYDLSPTQYNVLRILRGAEPEGLPCGEIAVRLVTREPDTTRLLDRMVKRGLVSRERSEADRRVVLTRIAREGLGVLSKLDGQIAGAHERQFVRLDPRQVNELIRLLELVRDA